MKEKWPRKYKYIRKENIQNSVVSLEWVTIVLPIKHIIASSEEETNKT